jgi:hypothetical protein
MLELVEHGQRQARYKIERQVSSARLCPACHALSLSLIDEDGRGELGKERGKSRVGGWRQRAREREAAMQKPEAV